MRTHGNLIDGNSRTPRLRCTAPLLLVLATPVLAAPATGAFEATRLIIEYNSTDHDIGVQFFVDAEEWQTVTIVDPSGRAVYTAEAKGRLLDQGGGSEMFVESVEPELSAVPIEQFFETFPEGTYRFVGQTADGTSLSGKARFTHNVPSGPVLIVPVPSGGAECASDTPIPATIAWNDVTTSIDGKPLQVDRYEVIVETEDTDFDVHLPKDGTMVTVPPEFLKPGQQYAFEVLAIEPGGNQTITSGCFVTSP